MCTQNIFILFYAFVYVQSTYVILTVIAGFCLFGTLLCSIIMMCIMYIADFCYSIRQFDVLCLCVRCMYQVGVYICVCGSLYVCWICYNRICYHQM